MPIPGITLLKFNNYWKDQFADSVLVFPKWITIFRNGIFLFVKKPVIC